MANKTAARLVRATATHIPQGEDPDELVFLDADLLILAASPGEFAAYERGIRREYSFVDDAAYHRGRGAVLRGFLERDRIGTNVARAEKRSRT